MTLSELERQPAFVKAFRKRNLYLFLLVICEILVLAFLASLRITTHKDSGTGTIAFVEFFDFYVGFNPYSWGTFNRLVVIVGLQIGFSHYAFVKAFKGKDMIQLHPRERSHGRRFGSLTGPELVVMVQKVAQELGVSHVDHIAVARQPDPNAYTARILGLGNVVVLHSNLLEILPREGLRAVIAHEIGHIRRKDSILYQIFNMPRSVAYLIVLLAFVKIVGGLLDSDNVWEILWRGLFMWGAVYLAVRAFTLLERLSNLASQQTELMVDAYAAHVCGWENHLNALLLVGERAEALGQFLEALQKVAERLGDKIDEKAALRILHRLPTGLLERDKAVELAIALYVSDRLTRLKDRLEVPLQDKEIEKLATQAARSMRKYQDELSAEEDEEGEGEQASGNDKEQEETRKQAREEKEKQEQEFRERLVEWRHYDSDRSGHLDAKELLVLVADLREHPQRMVFREFLEPDAHWRDHPTTRHRILFLAELFAPVARA